MAIHGHLAMTRVTRRDSRGLDLELERLDSAEEELRWTLVRTKRGVFFRSSGGFGVWRDVSNGRSMGFPFLIFFKVQVRT